MGKSEESTSRSEEWIERADRLGREWAAQDRSDITLRTAYIDRGLELVYERLNTVYRDRSEEIRQKAGIDVWKDLLRYDPEKSDLGAFLSTQIKRRVSGAAERETEKTEKAPEMISFDENAHDGEADGDGQSYAEKLAGKKSYEDAVSLANAIESAENEMIALLEALFVIFKKAQAGGPRMQKKARHFTMFYTERIVNAGRIVSFTGRILEREKDVINALDIPYFEFFTVPAGNETVTLKNIEEAELKPEGEIDPERSKEKILKFDRKGFLPAWVQSRYWWVNENQTKVLDSSISDYKKDYMKMLQMLGGKGTLSTV